MPSYNFRVEGLYVQQIRSGRRDTDLVTVGLTNKAVPHANPLHPAQTIDIGDVDIRVQRLRQVDLTIGPVDPAVNLQCVFTYIVLNSGYDRSNAGTEKQIYDALVTGTFTLADALIATAPVDDFIGLVAGGLLDALGAVLHWAAGPLFPDCDGVVAADAINLDFATVPGKVGSFGIYTETRPYHGTDSPAGCGANSLYNVSWSVVQVGSPADGQSVSLAAQHSGKCLDVVDGSIDDQANVQQFTCHGGPNQKWQFIRQGAYRVPTPARDQLGISYYILLPYYEIVAQHSGKCLDVAGLSLADGANVQQYTYNGGENQHWFIVPSDAAGYYIIINQQSGKVLDVAGIDVNDNANVQQFTFNNGENQKWSFHQ